MPDNTVLARKHAGNFQKNPNCVGDNVSPALEWVNAPDKTRSFVVLLDDQAGRAGLGVSHAVVYGIPSSVTSLAESELSAPPKAGRSLRAGTRSDCNISVLARRAATPCSITSSR